MDLNNEVKLTGDYSKDIDLRYRNFVYESTDLGSDKDLWRVSIVVNTTTTGYDVELEKGIESNNDSGSSFFYSPWFSTHIHFSAANLVQQLASTAEANSQMSFEDMEKTFTKFMVDVKNQRFTDRKTAEMYINSIMASVLDNLKIRNHKENLGSNFFSNVELHFSKAMLVAPGDNGYALGRTFKLDDKIKVFIHHEAIEKMCHKYAITNEAVLKHYIFKIMVHEYIHAYQIILDRSTDEGEAKIGMMKSDNVVDTAIDDTFRWAIDKLIKEE